MAIEDVAALGGCLDGPRLLALGARRQLAVAEDLQIDQARLDGDRPEQEKAEGQGDPALQRCAQYVGGLVGHAKNSVPS